MKTRRRLWIFLIVLLLLVPGGSVQAQDDDTQPLNDEFVEALVMMTVNHNLMAGDSELTDLRSLHGFVDDYYKQRIDAVKNNGSATADSDASWLQAQKDNLLLVVQKDIEKKKGGYRWVFDFLNLFTDAEKLEAATPSDMIRKVVSDSDAPPADYFDTMESLIMTNIEMQVNLLLDIQIIDVKPVLTPALQDSSPWSYNLPSVSDSSAPISPPAQADDESSPAQPAFDDPPPDDVENITILKPLRFSNNGFDAVTVIVESYTPAAGHSPTKPTTSTVVFPESNSSSYLELPLGTYTFCYEWELDEDFDNDDYIDYHHKSTNPTTLNVNSSDNPESAISVILSPDSIVSNPNGKCGQAAPERNANLVPEEAENTGTHVYTSTCSGVIFTVSCDDDPPENVSIQIEFTETAVIISNRDSGETVVYPRIGANQYRLTEESSVYTLTFTQNGFLINFTDNEWASNATLTFTRE
jgi:hypothetical protein